MRLGELAADIARHPILGAALALKGGSALNLCFGAPRRLSVDLDYNYIAHIDRSKMLEDRPRIEEALIDLAQRREYRIQRSADAFAGQKLFLGYHSVLGQEDRIEADLNFLFRLPIGEPATRSLWQPGDLDRARVRVVSLTELLAGKLLALLDRGAVRDAWDVANLSRRAAEEMASPLFRARFIAISAVLPHPLWTYNRDRLAGLVTDRAVAEQLAPMLATRGRRPRVDLVDQAWSAVAPLLSLDEHEAAYVAAIQKGELLTNLLFPNDAAEAEQMATHPAILWKLGNVRAHGTGQHSGPRTSGPPSQPQA